MPKSYPNMDKQDEAAAVDVHGLDRELQENSVEYMIFILDPNLDGMKYLSSLEAVRKDAIQLMGTVAKRYIWQRDEFNLELVNDGDSVYLRGVTDYGDAVEDEWLIVYVLRELTKLRADLWIRIADEDGEFLLVEAANLLPNWINPEIDHARVWIHDGKLKLIPARNDDGVSEASRSLSLLEAVRYIQKKENSLIHSPFIEAEAFYRLEKYPAHIAASIHHSQVTIPRKLAYILHSLPKSISAAVEAFYLRDHIGMKKISSTTTALELPPKDLVTVSVAFSRILFAQLRSQRFKAPSRWENVMQVGSEDRDPSRPLSKPAQNLEDGMKLTCGFEMLSVNAENHKSRVVREFSIMLADLREDGEDELPTDSEIGKWEDVRKADDEAWLDIDYAEFERELDGRNTRPSAQMKSGFGDARTQEDLRKIVSRFEAFLNDDGAGLDGAQMDDMDVDDDDEDHSGYEDDDSESEDKAVSFDEDAFSRMMKEMMGLPTNNTVHSEPAHEASSAQLTSKDTEQASDDHGNTGNDGYELSKLASQMESELKGHGALKLDTDRKQYRSATGASSSSREGTQSANASADGGGDSEVDIDYNLAKNLLESFKSQGGMAGPTGNLLGLMGISLPRDEDADDSEEETNGENFRSS